MNTTDLSQRLSARMHFKSLLLLTLLSASASAQQAAMPTIALDLPGVPEVSEWQQSSVTTSVTSEAARSTWTLRQHATWILGLKPRQANSNCLAPSLPEVPQVDIVVSAPQLFPMPTDTLITESLAADPLEAETHATDTHGTDANVGDAVRLVQHSEPLAVPGMLGEAPVVAAAVHTQNDSAPVAHALQRAPQGLNLSPVVSGPAPALPLERLEEGSLLQVDVNGVDVSKLVAAPPAPESLIEGLELRPPVGFSMNDRDTASEKPSEKQSENRRAQGSDQPNDKSSDQASVAASPSRVKAVSIHEGFAPRNSSANQATQLSQPGNAAPADRITISTPLAKPTNSSSTSASQFSMSDKTDGVVSGPFATRLSDKDSESSTTPSSAKMAVEKSFSDKGSMLGSMPVEVSAEVDKTSRSGKPVELTPPGRLASETPLALPLSSGMPIASTGAESTLMKLDSGNTIAKPMASTKPQDKPVLLDQLVAKPTSDKPTSGDSATVKPAGSLNSTVASAPTATATETKPVSNQSAPVKGAPNNSVVTKAQPAKPTEKYSLSDSNPIAMKRPVIKAATVALPKEKPSEVVQSSHEEDQANPETAEMAKMAAKMEQAVKQKFPSLRVKISFNEDGLIIDGNVPTNVEASKILSFVRKTSLCPVADRITTSQ